MRLRRGLKQLLKYLNKNCFKLADITIKIELISKLPKLRTRVMIFQSMVTLRTSELKTFIIKSQSFMGEPYGGRLPCTILERRAKHTYSRMSF
jgi:hypothetical protein